MMNSIPTTICIMIRNTIDAKVFRIPKWKLRFINRAGKNNNTPIFNETAALYKTLNDLSLTNKKLKPARPLIVEGNR